MPKVYSQKAAKDYDTLGIKKGDTYYSWSFRFGGEFKSKTPPRPSQLTQSKMSGALAAIEAVEDILENADNPGDIVDSLNEAAETIRGIGEEYQEAADAFENGGAIADQNSEKADQLNEWADSLENSASEIENLSATDYVDAEVEVEGKKGEERDVSEFSDLVSDEQSEYLSTAKDLAQENLSPPF